MHGANTGSAQVALEVQIEIGRIDTNEGIGPVPQQPLLELVAYAHKLSVMTQHLDVAAHGQFFAGPPGREAATDHLRSTDASRL